MVAFIPIILSTLASKAAPKLIDAIVDRIVADPSNPVTPAEAPAIRKEVAPVVEAATSAGKKPIIWGAVGSILAGLSSLAYAIGNGDASLEIYMTAATGILGGATTLVGVWRASR